MPFSVEFEDQVLNLVGGRGGHAYQVDKRARPTANQFLKWPDGDIVLFLGQLDDMLVFGRKRLEAEGRFWHILGLSPLEFRQCQ